MTAGSLANSLASLINQIVIDFLRQPINVGSLLDASHQHYDVPLGLLLHVTHPALDNIVESVHLVDVGLT